MRHTTRTIPTLFFTLILLCTLTLPTSQGCKDIVAVNDTTAGDYNLFMKVRDPSRPGLQVLCIVPKGTTYQYHHPWTGKPQTYNVDHSYIGVCTDDDILPNIVKSGMSLSTTGIAYGDADSGSRWINPSRYAWDDFDWIRYACDQATTEQEAVNLLTKECVDTLHATGVSETLFVVGPKKAYAIEADAYRYVITEIKDIYLTSNYPNALWKTQWQKTRPIAQSFDTVKQQIVRTGKTIRLGSLFGIRITKISDTWIEARQIPPLKIQYGGIRNVGKKIQIQQGERKTVGDFSITLNYVQGRKASVTIEYVFHAWKQELMSYITPHLGNITIQDMFSWSRLHREDLSNLRGMCEDAYPYEAVVVYKIPYRDYTTLASTWYSPNHACSSIYVPIHIQNTQIYRPYITTEAAQLSLDLLEQWGHKTLIPWAESCETVFLNENNRQEQIALLHTSDNTTAAYLNQMDALKQQQAYLTQQIWYTLYKESNQQLKDQLTQYIASLWNSSYTTTAKQIAQIYTKIENLSGSTWYQQQLETILFTIAESHLQSIKLYTTQDSESTKALASLSEITNEHATPEKINSLVDFCLWCEAILTDTPNSTQIITDESDDQFALTEINLLLIIILVLIIFFIIIHKKSNRN